MTVSNSPQLDIKLLDYENLVAFIKAARQLVYFWENVNLEKENLALKTTIAITEFYNAGNAAIWNAFNNSETVQYQKQNIRHIQPGCITKGTLQEHLCEDITTLYRDLKIEIFKIDELRTEEAIESATKLMKWNFYHHQEQLCQHILTYLKKVNQEI